MKLASKRLIYMGLLCPSVSIATVLFAEPLMRALGNEVWAVALGSMLLTLPLVFVGAVGWGRGLLLASAAFFAIAIGCVSVEEPLLLGTGWFAVPIGLLAFAQLFVGFLVLVGTRGERRPS